MRRALIIIGLEGYALALAWIQSLGGVRTDEAKYLLDIPYPHPPLMRWVLNLTEGFTYQEMLWRMIFATLLVQAVWLVYHAAVEDPHLRHRGYGSAPTRNGVILCALYLLSTPLLFQSGTIMMAPLTALMGLGLVVVYKGCHPECPNNCCTSIHPAKRGTQCDNCLGVSKDYNPTLISLLWLISLFTAYQAILYAPLAYVLLRKRTLYFITPIILVGLYTLTNPLVLASLTHVGGHNAGIDTIGKVHGMLRLWVLGGSGVVSLLGTAAIVRSKSLPLLLSLQLVVLYTLVIHLEFYAILFLPLFIGGLLLQPKFLEQRILVLACTVISSGTLLYLYPLKTEMSAARQTMQVINNIAVGSVAIHGSFGHEWQYESTSPVYRYTINKESDAIVCLDACEDLSLDGYKRLDEAKIETYVLTST